MTKARIAIAATALAVLVAAPAVAVPALAASPRTASGTSTGVSSSGPLLSVCLTVTPKSVSVAVNGQQVAGQSAGLPRTCVATPF